MAIIGRNTKKEYLQHIENSFTLTIAEMKNIVKDFHSEMRRGLAGLKSSLAMIPTYVDKPTGDEKGEYIALDLGGTNFRVLELKLKGKGKLSPPRVRKYVLDKRHISGKGEELFGYIAQRIKAFLRGEKARQDDVLKLGFTFSFPVEQTGIASGELLGWTKGFSARGVVGKDVVMLLNSALAKNGLGNIKVAVLANDTVGTMACLGYEDQDCDVGVILGTGTNACYLEKLSVIPKWNGPNTRTGHMIINIEWGNFNKLRRLDYDIALDKASENPGRQILEKMISGMYLGEVARIVLNGFISKGLLFDGLRSPIFNKRGHFKTEYMSRIEADCSKNLSEVIRFLKESGIRNSTFEDRCLIKRVCELVSNRAARASAAAMAAVITKIDPALSKTHTVAIDGSVYEKHPGFSKNIRTGLEELLDKKASKIKISMAKDGSGKGAAIIAAVA